MANITLRGELRGHTDWVTAIATTPVNPTMVLSSSRDRSIICLLYTSDAADE